jgi:branched-chain amino acid transport system ATP-binding protein
MRKEGGSRVLKITNLHASFGNNHVLKGISLEVNKGEIVTLIGNNGAGKTTAIKTIIGLLKPDSGRIQFNNQDIAGLKPDNIVKYGIVLVPEGRQIFPFMSVVENLHMGAYSRIAKELIDANFDKVYNLFPQLYERRRQQAGTLSKGIQQMLAFGKVLMAQPKLILLDEPSIVLAPMLSETTFDIICEINKQGTSILLIEQNARMALMVANRGYVLEEGSIVQQDKAETLLHSDIMRRDYLV